MEDNHIESVTMNPHQGMGPIIGVYPVGGVWAGQMPIPMIDVIIEDLLGDLYQSYDRDQIAAMITQDPHGAIRYIAELAILRTAQRIHVEFGNCQIAGAIKDAEY